MARGTIIKYQWTDKQQAEVIEIMERLKKLVYQRDIWNQIEETPPHDKHEIRVKLEGLFLQVSSRFPF